MSLPINKIVLGDCTKVMKDFPENSIDCIVTDPPYGLSFMGKEWDKALPPKDAFLEMYRVLKPGALAFVMSSPRQDLMWRMAQLLENSGFNLWQSFISWIYNNGFPKAFDIAKAIDSKKGIEPKVVGKDSNFGAIGERTYGTWEGEWDITEPVSDEAKQWKGWKSVTGLKPALEVIFMVQKPMTEKTIADNVLKWGTGGINIDACRIPLKDGDEWNRSTTYKTDMRGGNYGNMENQKMYSLPPQENNPKGRFSANLIVSDDMLNDGEITASKKIPEGTPSDLGKYGIYRNYEPFIEERGYDDSGSKSRYFDLDAWAKHHGFLQVPKASPNEREAGAIGEKDIQKSKFNLNNGEKDERFDGGNVRPRVNVHPTVKPVKLMAYLIELGCPKDGIVLDPFVGSGTTCIAAKAVNKKYIGIEINEEYHKLAEDRVMGARFNSDLEVIKEPFSKVEQKDMTDLTHYWG